MKPEVHLELREIYRDHLGQEDITVQMAVIEFGGYRLWFTQLALLTYVDQLSETDFQVASNTYVMVETYDGERYFVRREDGRIIVVVPDLDHCQCDWQLLRTAILKALEE